MQRLIPAALSFCSLLQVFKGSAQSLPEFDFTQPAVAQQWQPNQHIAAMQVTPEGLELSLAGPDPYLSGPPRDYPADAALWMLMRLKSEQGGLAQVFYFREEARAEDQVTFQVRPNQWNELRVPLPPLNAGHRLRIDPPGTRGKTVLANIRFESRVELPQPQWPPWVAPAPPTNRGVVSGPVEIVPGDKTPRGFEVRINGQSMAFGHPSARIAYLKSGQARWVALPADSTRVKRLGPQAFSLATDCADADGATWFLQQTFHADSPGTVRTETTVRVSQDREVLFLPMHLLIAGEGSFGRRKGQGLFAGLEYLEDEPSSSEADLVGPESKRQVPASHKITFPLMALQADGRYLALIWEDTSRFAALFDSPDRIFNSGGHVMGVLWPGSDGANRVEGNLFPKYPELLKANQPLVSRAWIVGGVAESVIPAVQHYVKLRGLPALPDAGMNLAGYASLAAQSWLHSKIRDGNLYRHALGGGFHPTPAANAAVFELWLAGREADPAQAAALLSAASNALAEVKPANYYHRGVGYVHTPVAVLVFGHLEEAIEAARDTARRHLGEFAADGTIPFRNRRTDGLDFGITHFASDANGLTGTVVTRLLEAAAFCGDSELISEALERLRAMRKFHHTVPRGAQTWEIPLHTPDILASAYLVRACIAGHELSGDRKFLDEAIYWAWTGVPFVYLINPTGQPVGPYATIAVLGATHWKAPVWMGLPVQWCGLVYADALYRLAPHDPAGPWRQLADGITVSGLQQSYPASDRDRAGLLPDSFNLLAQTRHPADINAATLGACAVRFFTRTPLYDFRALDPGRLLVHAPGAIVPLRGAGNSARFTVRSWSSEPYHILINGLIQSPTVLIDGQRAVLDSPHAFRAAAGQLILRVSGNPTIEIEQ